MTGEGQSGRLSRSRDRARARTGRGRASERPRESREPRTLTAQQTAAIRAVMRLFVDDDIAKGVSHDQRLHCDACERARPAPGYIRYDGRVFCNSCAIEYELARARGLIRTVTQFLRERLGGDGEVRVQALPRGD